MNVTVYVPQSIESILLLKAKALKVTPSKLIQNLLKETLREDENSFSPEFVALAGSWEDSRSAKEIAADLKRHRISPHRMTLR